MLRIEFLRNLELINYQIFIVITGENGSGKTHWQKQVLSVITKRRKSSIYV